VPISRELIKQIKPSISLSDSIHVEFYGNLKQSNRLAEETSYARRDALLRSNQRKQQLH
jgi:hypothetical protein